MSTTTVIDDLCTDLPIPDGGTLSRVLYRDDRMQVAGFAFDAGQELTEHTSALPVVIQVIRGPLDLILGEEKAQAVPGSRIHLPARLPHTVSATEPTAMLLTMLAAPARPAGPGRPAGLTGRSPAPDCRPAPKIEAVAIRAMRKAPRRFPHCGSID
jgi:quercetin dioxygenase-like cupin family protein